MFRPLALLVSAVALSAAVSSADAAVITVTAEAANVTNSTAPGTVVETFESLGKNSNPSGTALPNLPGATLTGGIILDSLVSPHNQWTGATNPDNSQSKQYFAVGTQSNSTSATLTLPNPATYFGLWWAAIDGDNKLEFYDAGNNLLGSFTRTSLQSLVNFTGYYGNPLNRSVNSGEAYAFLNFTSDTPFTTVKFVNSKSTGFEVDNFTLLQSELAPPANVPEPATVVTLGLVAACGAGYRRFRAA